MPRPHEIGDATSVDTRVAQPLSVQTPRPRLSPPAPTGSRSHTPQRVPLSAAATSVSVTASNVIPFAKPRAMAALPATYSPAPVFGAAPVQTFGAAPVQTFGAAPVQTFGAAPVHSLGAAPAQTSGAAPVHSLGAAPAHSVGAAPAQTFSAAPAHSVGATSAQAASPGWGAARAARPLPSGPPTWGAAAVAAAAAVIVPSPAIVEPALPARMPQATTPPAIVAPAPRAPTNTNMAPAKWAAFENLGLRAPTIDHKKWSGHVVTAYRLLGFVILSIIVVVLVGYLVTTAFFYMSNSWVVPMALSPTDEKVVSLQSQLSERQTNRDRTAAELEQAERAIAVQQQFQAEFAKAIKSDLDGRKAALAKMYELASVAASTRANIKRSNSAYASASQKRMAEEWRAGLIDRDTMLNGKFQMAQISSSNLSLAERQAEYETRAADLDAQTRSLEALLSDTTTDGSLSYDVLKIKQEYETSRLETQRAIETRDMLRTALAREDKLVEALKKSSYIKALADDAQVAFVPYANIDKITKGAPLYGCALTMVFCKRVGTVLEVLPGEVQFKHPNRDKQLRGQMVELKLDHDSSATDDVLFVGGRPMFL